MLTCAFCGKKFESERLAVQLAASVRAGLALFFSVAIWDRDGYGDRKYHRACPACMRAAVEKFLETLE